jgi:thiosulfate dehydrogenase [quinone] large subunit
MKNRIDTVKRQPPAVPLPAPITQVPNQEVRAKRFPGWAVLPLRLFLGITFIYAGMQKLTDPQYFDPSARRYIGNQIAAFATGSPIHGFLVNFAEPHAMLFGALVVYGELAIGLGALFGLLLRPAAFCGILLNILFFLSATWRVYPYFYGSDIVFIFCWITLLIAGPASSVLPSLDTLLAARLLKFLSTQQRTRVAPLLRFILGSGETSHDKSGIYNAPAVANHSENKQIPTNVRRNYRAQATLKKQSRRNFLWGVVTGGAGMLGLVWLSSLFHTAPQTPDSPASNSVGTAPQATDTATSGTPQAPGVIAQVSQVPTNSAAEFTLPSNGDPGVLVHLDDGKFVAYDAACTHAGCPVSYDPGSKLLLCPCHGAAFDPAKDAAVVQGPAQTPLTSVPINVDNASGTISLSS